MDERVVSIATVSMAFGSAEASRIHKYPVDTEPGGRSSEADFGYSSICIASQQGYEY